MVLFLKSFSPFGLRVISLISKKSDENTAKRDNLIYRHFNEN